MGTHAVSDRTRRLVGWTAASVALLLFATTPLLWSGGVASRPGITHGSTVQDLMASIVILSYAFSGAALVHARPRNWIGWILLAVGLLQAIQISTDAYGARALTDPDGSLPLGLASTWIATWTWLPAVLIPITVLPAIYPTGHPPSRFWRWHVRLSFVGIGLLVLTAATTQGGIDDTVAGTRLPWDAPLWWAAAVGFGAAGILIPATVVTIVGTVLRALHARAPERQQLVWLVSVVAAMLATVFLPVDYVFGIAYTCVPIAVVVGVLRYRLLGIEVALRRTLLYALLTVLVALTIGVLTTLLARLVPEGPAPSSWPLPSWPWPCCLPRRFSVGPSTGSSWATEPTRSPWSTGWERDSSCPSMTRCPRCWRRWPSRPGRRTHGSSTMAGQCWQRWARSSGRPWTSRCVTAAIISAP